MCSLKHEGVNYAQWCMKICVENILSCGLTNPETHLGGVGCWERRASFRPICSKLRFCLLNTIAFRIIRQTSDTLVLKVTAHTKFELKLILGSAFDIMLR